MKLTENDPRLTAYALGELEGAELEAVAREVAASADLKRQVEAIRRTADILTQELQAEPVPACKPVTSKQADAQAAGALAALASQRRGQLAAAKPARRTRWLRWALPSAVVAALVVLVSTIALPILSPVRELARRATPGEALYVHDSSYARSQAPMSPGLLGDLPVKQGDESPGQFEGPPGFSTEAYDHIVDNPFLRASENPLSTFSIDVDTASYSNVRRFLATGQRPPKGAVRIEEMVNYFPYRYPSPAAGEAFSINIDAASCPWAPAHRLVRIGLKGREIPASKRPPTNLVFLLDVSGSMDQPNKLPLVKSSMRMLAKQLTENDRLAIVVYAGASGLVLPSTTCDRQEQVLSALDNLSAGGSTNGGEGIRLAYAVAAEHFIKGGVNRVILCTDGDFNVGTTNQSELVDLVEKNAKGGVFLSVLGFGMGNYKDSTLEKLADKGNGNYAYIDTEQEARKNLVEQMTGTLITIAKDVKIQVEFNPSKVQAYRLIGYENRMLRKEDFNDDTKDAGEIGAGHTVTALYELVPPGEALSLPAVDPLKYQPATAPAAGAGDELLTVKVRHKLPDGDKSELITRSVRDSSRPVAKAGEDFRFAAAVAAFGMILRESPYKGTYTLDGVEELAKSSLGPDRQGYRAEFVDLVAKAKHVMAATEREQ